MEGFLKRKGESSPVVKQVFSQEIVRAFVLSDFLAKIKHDSVLQLSETCLWHRKGLSIRIMKHKVKIFRRENFDCHNAPSEGNTKSATNEEYVASVANLVEKDPHITYQFIQQELGIGVRAFKTILKDHLGFSKECERWVSHCLIGAKNSAAWTLSSDSSKNN